VRREEDAQRSWGSRAPAEQRTPASMAGLDALEEIGDRSACGEHRQAAGRWNPSQGRSHGRRKEPGAASRDACGRGARTGESGEASSGSARSDREESRELQCGASAGRSEKKTRRSSGRVRTIFILRWLKKSKTRTLDFFPWLERRGWKKQETTARVEKKRRKISRERRIKRWEDRMK
jgi:hypothetical protein